MHTFSFLFLENGLIPARFVNLAAEISSLKTKITMYEKKYPRFFQESEQSAAIPSAKYSVGIENAAISDERISDILSGNRESLTPGEAGIAGYRDALMEIRRNYENLGFREDDIFHLYHILMHSKEKNAENTSDAQKADHMTDSPYKKADTPILEHTADGTTRIKFRPVSAAGTPDAMRKLLFAYREAADSDNVSPLLLIPCVILDFLCIHPFRKGSGRMSLLLSHLLLYKSGFDISRYSSLEKQIHRNRNTYYESMRRSSQRWETGENSYFPFMESFLTMLLLCYREFDNRFDSINGKRITKKERIKQAVLSASEPVSKSEICRLLPDISQTTVEAVLGTMTKSGSIERIGAGRGSRYVKKSIL